MSIILSGVSFHYANQQSLFKYVNLSVALGRKVSIVGNNGTGKSTLLKLISGDLSVATGSVQCASTPYYIPQQIGITGIPVSRALNVADKIEALYAICEGSDRPEHYAVLADDWNIESRCLMALDAWGLSNIGLTTPIDSLSGGEKTKLFLAGMLIHRPAVVLLDEPTNHLDLSSRQKLYDWVLSSRSTVVVVSHDVTLLNLLNETYELSTNGLKRYGGNYDFYKIQKEVELQALNLQINAEESALKLAQRKAKEVHERQEKRVRQGARSKDGLPRIMWNLVKNRGENTDAKLREKHEEIVERNDQRLADLRQKRVVDCELKLNFDSALLHNGKLLISARGVNFRYDTKGFLWSNPLDVAIRSGERIHLTGHNGSGKTTLLKLLIGDLLPSVGEVERTDFSFVYLDQEYSKVKTERTVLELVQEYNHGNLLDHELKLRLHRALFPKEVWNRSCRVLSGGERMRLYLCCLMISNHIPDLFILDEPTNNLDLSSLDILTSTIKEYRGTLLVISHDNRFVEEIGVDRVVEL